MSDIRPIRLIIADRLIIKTQRLRLRIATILSPELDVISGELRQHLDRMNSDLYESRYGENGPCGGCYDAVAEFDRLKGADHASR